MRSILFSIGNIHIYGYGAMIALGLILCFSLASFRAKRNGVDPDLMFNAGIIGVVSGLVGAKLTYWIVHLRSVLEDPSQLLDLGGGFVVYGGLIFGVLAAVLYLRIRKTTVPDKLDLAMPSIAVGQGVGRLGCYLAGCCYGTECSAEAWYAVVFPADSMAPSGVPLVPVQLISSFCLLLLAGVLILRTKKQKFAGSVVLDYMFLYSIGRFLIEFIRDEDRGTVWVFSTSQFIAIVVILCALVLYPFLRKANYKTLRQLKEEQETERPESDIPETEGSAEEDGEHSENEENGADEPPEEKITD